MILLWDGNKIEAVDLDKVIPGPRAEEVAALLEPGYLRGYLEGRGHDVAIREIKKRGRLGRDYRQIQKLLRKQPSSPPQGAPWQYAMFLKERVLEQQATPAPTEKAGSPGTTTLPVDDAVQPTMPVEEQTEASAVDDAEQPERPPTMPVEEQTEAPAVDDAEQPTMPVEEQNEASAVDDVQPAELRVDDAQHPTTPSVDEEEPPNTPSEIEAQRPEVEQATTSAADEVQENGAEQTTTSAVDDAQPSVVQSDVRETTDETAAQNDRGGGKKRRKRRRKKRRKNCASANDTCQ